MSIPSWARAGAKVVCVRDFSEASCYSDLGYRDLPKLHEVYVITGTVHAATYGAVVLYLVGFPHDHGFDLRGFKPLVTLEDDITTYFAELLDTPVRIGEKA